MKDARGEGGVRELLRVAYPLILSTASNTIMQFTNRVFLAHYSPDALAACVPAGILSFTFLCFFIGMASYTNAFVSQYYGSGKKASISVAVWQGAWLALFSGALVLALTPVGLGIIARSGHAAAVRALEAPYFAILNSFAFFPVLNAALAAFFTGRGDTKVTMYVNIAGNLLCVLLSWTLVFGAGPFPELGIRGAGWAAAGGQMLMTAVYLALILSGENRRRYRTARLVGVHRGLFSRLVRYGAPNGVGFLLDVASFGAFVFIVGGLDKLSLAANNIIASINMISFMPVLGMGMATLTLVGKYVGMKKPDVSVRVTLNAVKLAAVYSLVLAVMFFLLPGLFINIFGSGIGDRAAYAEILARTRPLMKALAFFTVFDGMGVVLADALRGAGDTRFQMVAGSAAAWLLFVPGVWYIVHHGSRSLFLAWVWGGLYVFTLFVLFGLRFRAGRWRRIDILRG